MPWRWQKRLDRTNFRPLFDNVTEVVERSFILPLRHRSTNVKVDLALGLSGFEQRAISRAEPLDAAGRTVSVVTAEDLLVMKVLAGRPHDEQDARGIVIAQRDRLDWEYCLEAARELGEALAKIWLGRFASYAMHRLLERNRRVARANVSKGAATISPNAVFGSGTGTNVPADAPPPVVSPKWSRHTL